MPAPPRPTCAASLNARPSSGPHRAYHQRAPAAGRRTRPRAGPGLGAAPRTPPIPEVPVSTPPAAAASPRAPLSAPAPAAEAGQARAGTAAQRRGRGRDLPRCGACGGPAPHPRIAAGDQAPPARPRPASSPAPQRRCGGVYAAGRAPVPLGPQRRRRPRPGPAPVPPSVPAGSRPRRQPRPTWSRAGRACKWRALGPDLLLSRGGDAGAHLTSVGALALEGAEAGPVIAQGPGSSVEPKAFAWRTLLSL